MGSDLSGSMTLEFPALGFVALGDVALESVVLRGAVTVLRSVAWEASVTWEFEVFRSDFLI